MKSGSPSRTTATHKTQTKTQAWSSLVFQCRHSSFYSFRSSSVGLETGEWRRCHSLSFTPPASLRSHGSRPRPTRHMPPSPLAGRGVLPSLRSTPPLPPLPGGARQGGRGVPGGKDRRGERKETEGWGVRERGERKKNKNLGPVPGHTAARSSTNWAAHSRCHAMVLDLFGGQPDAPSPGGRRWLLQSRAAGSESPVPCSSTNLANGSRLRPTGERRRLLRSLSDGSHPSSSQEHGSESSVPPVLLLLQHHRFGSPWRSPPLPAARSSQHRDPTQQRGLSDSVSLLPPGLRHQCNEVVRYGKKEAGTGEYLRHI